MGLPHTRSSAIRGLGTAKLTLTSLRLAHSTWRQKWIAFLVTLAALT